MYMQIPNNTYSLIDNSFLNDKMKRNYKRVLEERTMRFIRKSEWVFFSFQKVYEEHIGGATKNADRTVQRQDI